MSRLKWYTIVIFCGGLLFFGCEKGGGSRNGESNDTAKAEDTQTAWDTESEVQEEETEEESTNEPLRPVPLCVKDCSTAADCVEVGADYLHREPNYSCDNGLCIYTGCVDDDNCAQVYSFPAHVCSANGDCLPPCESADDCAITGADVDADNWECNAGGCEYLGCLNSYECVSIFGNEYICTDVMHVGISNCQAGCSVAQNCVHTTDTDQKAYDVDNYACISKKGEISDACDYKGCSSDAECGDGYKCVEADK